MKGKLMKSTKTKFMAIAASAALVAMLGLAACGGGSSSSSSAAASASASASAAASASTAASASASSSAAASSAATSASTAASASAATSASAAASAGSSAAGVDTSNMLAYMGVSDKGETFYFAVDDANNEGILAALNPQTGEYASFVGPITSPSDTQITITDTATNISLTFEVTAADNDGNMAIDMGEQGKAVLAKCTMEEVMEALETIAKNGTEVNPANDSGAASSSNATTSASATETQAASNVDTSDLEAYMGMSTANEAYYLAMDKNATEGILVIMNEKGEYLSFVGPIATQGTMMQITDQSTGDSFGFEITAADDGGVILDAGDAAGKIVLAQCSVDEVVEALAAIDSQGTAVN